MRKAIRIKHYSYSTERTYIDWAKRFFDYTLNIKKNEKTVQNAVKEAVKKAVLPSTRLCMHSGIALQHTS
jgi:hypothetical protein